MTADERPKYQYIIRDPKTEEIVDILNPHERSCMGGPDTCGGCDACLLKQAEHNGFHVERQRVKDDTAMADGIFPWALDCEVCGHWEYAPGEMKEPDQSGHHPNCTHYIEPRGATARLNVMVRANRECRRLKRRIKELEAPKTFPRVEATPLFDSMKQQLARIQERDKTMWDAANEVVRAAGEHLSACGPCGNIPDDEDPEYCSEECTYCDLARAAEAFRLLNLEMRNG